MTDPGKHVSERADKPAVSDSENSPAPANLLARLGRWWERERWPGPAETKTLFSARLTDVAANRLARRGANATVPPMAKGGVFCWQAWLPRMPAWIPSQTRRRDFSDV